MQGLQGPLTLVIAPAGFGKTTVVSACIADCGAPVAWLSLDKHDNEVGRFLNYVVAALQEADNKIVSEASQFMVESQQAPPEVILTHLINNLDRASGKIILVLDDYHFISNEAVHEAVAFLLEHCPNTFHLVIVTRSDPLLPLARMRARGQTVELRAADLSFTEPEAAQFLNDVMNLHLDAESVAVLEERTEGWIAGLQMAALSMRYHEDVHWFIKSFSGTHRYILDYLLEEVLAGQPPEIQHFLLCTSILERMTAPLCDAVISASLSEGLADDEGLNRSEAVFLGESASILDYLERANIFLVPLDDERTWYRYHHLFADLLHTRLDQMYPGSTQQLHTRAANWLEQEGMTVEAVNHMLSAGEYDRAARMVEENTTRLLAQGELNALMGWIETLPADLRLTRPWLCVHQAYALMFAGRTAEVEPLLAQAMAVSGAASAQGTLALSGQGENKDPLAIDNAETQALKSAVAAVQAFSAAIVQDTEALSKAQQARQLLAPGDLFNQSLIVWATGYILHSQGHLTEARSAFEKQIRLGRAMQNNAILMIGLTALARVLGDQGKLSQARALIEDALVDARQKGSRNLGFIARMEAHLAAVLYEQNELEAAHHLLSEALTHARFWLNPNHQALIYSYLARVLLAKGDLSGARIAIGEVDQMRKKAQLSPWLRSSAEVEMVWMWLAIQSARKGAGPSDPLAEQSSLILASWRNELAADVESQDSFMDQQAELIRLTLARAALASGQIEESLCLLEPVTRRAQTAGHNGLAVGSLILTALAHQSKPGGIMLPALRALEEALALAEPDGYVRIFLNEGKPMQMLLAQWLAHANTGPLRDYAKRLLSQSEVETHDEVKGIVSPISDPSAESRQNLTKLLSQRELEVLHLMALGCANQEIARQLIVAPGTIKAHTANIYRKLEVGNRTEAVARARQLGILP